jgi:translation initiation factor eIF-2B subunit epsilon
MSSKASNSKKASSNKGKKPAITNADEDYKKDQKLQAILLADLFSESFDPVTGDVPLILFPLVNVPVIEYTIEFLTQNGVEEIFVFCVSHYEKIQVIIEFLFIIFINALLFCILLLIFLFAL